MIDIWSLTTIGLAFFVVAASPGPANISNATIAMSKGRKPSLYYGFGLSAGLLFWGIVAASGMGAVLQSSIYLLLALKIFAGIYLLWLAYASFTSSISKAEPAAQTAISSQSYTKWFLRGLVLNTSNPKTVVAWMAALSVGMDQYSDALSLIAAVFVCMLVGLLVNACYSMLFSVDGVMKGYKKFSHWIEGVTAAIFALAGGTMLRSAFVHSKSNL